MLRNALVVATAAITLLVLSASIQAKEPLAFEKIVIVAGGDIDSPVEITGSDDLTGSELDSMRPAAPSQSDLGTSYRVVLYPEGSAAGFEVTYYASRSGDRGYIYQEQPVLVGGGTIDPGWDRPSEALESILRQYGAVNVSSQSNGSGLDLWQVVAIPAAAVTFALIGLGCVLMVRRIRRLPRHPERAGNSQT